MLGFGKFGLLLCVNEIASRLGKSWKYANCSIQYKMTMNSKSASQVHSHLSLSLHVIDFVAIVNEQTGTHGNIFFC